MLRSLLVFLRTQDGPKGLPGGFVFVFLFPLAVSDLGPEKDDGIHKTLDGIERFGNHHKGDKSGRGWAFPEGGRRKEIHNPSQNLEEVWNQAGRQEPVSLEPRFSGNRVVPFGGRAGFQMILLTHLGLLFHQSIVNGKNAHQLGSGEGVQFHQPHAPNKERAPPLVVTSIHTIWIILLSAGKGRGCDPAVHEHITRSVEVILESQNDSECGPNPSNDVHPRLDVAAQPVIRATIVNGNVIINAKEAIVYRCVHCEPMQNGRTNIAGGLCPLTGVIGSRGCRYCAQ
mmetsp:Transcript_14536/g.40300  ORF Transcript_14536/g.40300 Transcript_14536/m.40300 type:complete len:285 (-) Transcript_14536:308-1162(-)